MGKVIFFAITDEDFQFCVRLQEILGENGIFSYWGIGDFDNERRNVKTLTVEADGNKVAEFLPLAK
jgi:hypothetical protein